MKPLSRSLLFAGLLLLFASSLPAQRFLTSPTYNFNGGYGGYGYSGYGWGGYGGWDYGFGGASYGDYCLHHPEEHPPFGVGYAHGDPDFVQSTFMEYEKALELGKKILEEQARPQPSLGEIARQLRLRTRRCILPPAPSSETAPGKTPQKPIVIQGNGSELSLCTGSDQTCRNAA